MKLKTKLKPFLIFGTSILFVTINSSCKQDVDFEVNSKWIFINETNHKITYSPTSVWDDFELIEKDTFIFYQNSEGPRNVEIEDFNPPLIVESVILDGVLCDKSTAQKLQDISEYESKKISERNFEFIFRFTNEKFVSAETCTK